MTATGLSSILFWMMPTRWCSLCSEAPVQSLPRTVVHTSCTEWDRSHLRSCKKLLASLFPSTMTGEFSRAHQCAAGLASRAATFLVALWATVLWSEFCPYQEVSEGFWDDRSLTAFQISRYCTSLPSTNRRTDKLKQFHSWEYTHIAITSATHAVSGATPYFLMFPHACISDTGGTIIVICVDISTLFAWMKPFPV